MAEFIVRKVFHEPGYAAAEVGEVGEWNYLARERKAELVADGSLEQWSVASGQWPVEEVKAAEPEPEVAGYALADPLHDSHPDPLPEGEGGKARRKRGGEVSDGVA